MFDISELKEMKLPELQEIAKKAKINKYRGLKKDELVYQILDHQAANPAVIKPLFEETAPAEKNTDAKPAADKQKRMRITPADKNAEAKPQQKPAITPQADTATESGEAPAAKPNKEFRKPAIEAKGAPAEVGTDKPVPAAETEPRSKEQLAAKD